jgi:hypothetical protein
VEFLVGNKGCYPARNIENGKEGWAVLVEERPDGTPDLGHVWIGGNDAPARGWTRIHTSNVRAIRYWNRDDPAMPATLRHIVGVKVPASKQVGV